MNIISDLLERHLLDIPYWGHLPAAMRLKKDAVTRVGASAAFDLLKDALQVPGVDTLKPRKIAELGATARSHGLSFVEVWPTGEPFLREPLNVRGGATPERMPGQRRAAYLACLQDATVRGRSSVVAWGDFALLDAERNEATAFADNPEYDPGILAQEGDVYWMMHAHEPALHVEEAFWLAGSHSVDFGHWIVEYLPKLMIARRGGLPAGVPVLVDTNIPATMRAALPLFLPEGTDVISVPHLASVQVDRLWVAPTPEYESFYATEWNEAVWDVRSVEPDSMAGLLTDLRDMASARLIEPTGMEKIFLARKPTRFKKKLTNYEQIEWIARDRGFHVVYPEDYSFVDQLRLARFARQIIAPDGSNSLVAFFANPGTRVCTLSPPYAYPLADIGSILASLGISMTVLIGPDLPEEDRFGDFWNDYSIDPGLFSSYLDENP